VADKKTIDYFLTKVDREFWKRVKQLALDKNTSIKGLILFLLKREINKKTLQINENR
jgi:hypothetical protein